MKPAAATRGARIGYFGTFMQKHCINMQNSLIIIR